MVTLALLAALLLLAVAAGIVRATRQNTAAHRMPAGLVPAQAAGRHRRPDGELHPGTVSATGIMRAVNAEADLLPAIPRGRVKARR